MRISSRLIAGEIQVSGWPTVHGKATVLEVLVGESH